MYEIPQETYYVMDMLDHSDLQWRQDEISLDRIATEVYGKTYIGQQTGEMMGNDTSHVYDFSTEDDVLEWLQDPEDMGFYKNPIPGQVLGDITYHSVKGWLARDTSNDRFDFEDYRAGPEPRTMLATLIHDGHLPYGKYLINVSW